MMNRMKVNESEQKHNNEIMGNYGNRILTI